LLVGSFSLYKIVGTTSSESSIIQSTLAVDVLLRPTSSSYSNVKLPFSSNLNVSFPSLFKILTFGLLNSIVAVTFL